MKQAAGARRTIGVDTGGTFTDLICIEPGARGEAPTERSAKVSSTPLDPSAAVLLGLERLGGVDAETEVVHGTTVALNTLLTGRHARTALVTNKGFRDLIEIARQDRPELYALHPTRPAPIVPRELRFEIAQRSWPENGRVVEARAPSPAEVAALAKRIAVSGAESVAVCLLHSYADVEPEARLARELAGLGLPITASAAIHAEHREYERFSTAVINAALVPRVRDYLTNLAAQLGGARLRVLQSNGGTLPAERAGVEPVRIVFSGPAGGVVGAARAAREAGLGDIVALDMGGTSTDVAYHSPSGSLAHATGSTRGLSIAGHPVAVPGLDIHTIGCGGGSLVRVDAGGVLHVGPESAGADPGPVCYGRGDVPTVTDAHVYLGHIDRGAFVGGELELDHDGVRRTFERLAGRLGVRPERAAQGVLDVARAAMRRAIGVMTMQRGEDPKRLPLVAFGGAGGLAAAALAESLDMTGALVPARPGVLSAWGMALADGIRDHVVTVLEPIESWNAAARARTFKELAARGRRELLEDGHAAGSIEYELALDLRYGGQSFEISVPEPGTVAGTGAGSSKTKGRRTERGRTSAAAVAETFHVRHAALYGYRLDDRTVELVGLRARAVARHPGSLADARDGAASKPRARAAPQKATIGTRHAWFERRERAAVVDRTLLAPGHVVSGPALVEEFSGTTIVPPGWKAHVTHGGHLWLTNGSPAGAKR